MRLLETFARREGEKPVRTSTPVDDDTSDPQTLCVNAIKAYKAEQGDDYMTHLRGNASFVRAAVFEVEGDKRVALAAFEYNHIRGTGPVDPNIFQADQAEHLIFARS